MSKKLKEVIITYEVSYKLPKKGDPNVMRNFLINAIDAHFTDPAKVKIIKKEVTYA